MRYLVLGPLQVLEPGGRPLPIRGRVDRAILGALLLEPNGTVSRDRLTEAVWGDEPPETAPNAIQVHISKLRKLLGGAGGSNLHTRSPGYALEVRAGELDASEFEGMATAPRSDEPPSEVSVRLTEALRLWRGPVLDGMDVGTFGQSDVSRLEDLRVSVLEWRIDADLALGRHRELTGELESVVQTYPLREHLRGQLMLALYRSGRQADALAAYRQARELLIEDLGIDPSQTLQALELAILEQSAALDLVDRGQPALTGTHQRVPAPDAAAGDIPLPGRLAVPPQIGLIGRTGELQTIALAYKRVAHDGGREVMLVAGEAGLGKTTLTAAAALAAHDDGALVLFGHCEEDLARPYQFFAEALEHYVTHASDEQLAQRIAPNGADLTRLLPSVGRKMPGLPATKGTDTDTERYLLFAAVAGVMADLARVQPVVLVLDDLQWADRGSLLLLRHLAAAEQIPRLLILATYRDSELRHADALRDTLGALRRQSGVQRIELSGLNDHEVVSYFEAASGQLLDAQGLDLAHAVYRETDGNPFFVGEVLRHLVESGAIYRDAEGRWVAGATLETTVLPDSVREVVGGRVVRLGKEAERVLALAAVIGREFDLDLLAQAAGAAEDDVLDILEDSAGAALVSEFPDAPGRFQFTHALIQHTLYDDLRPTRRARAHRQVAEALEEVGAASSDAWAGQLARHWVAAIQPTDLAKAIGYSRRAGDAALAALAPADAVRYYTQALDLGTQGQKSDPVLDLDLRVGLGTALRQTGDPSFRNMLLEACRRAATLGDTDRLVAACLANSRGTFSTVSTIDEEKVEVLEAALDRLSHDDVRRALLLATLCSELTVGSSLERRQSLADEALEIAHRLGDDETVIRVINHVLLPLSLPHLLDRSTQRAEEALVRAEAVKDPILLCTAASGRRLLAASAGDIAEMDRCYEIKARLVERLDLPFLTWVHTLQGATRALVDGDPDRGEQLAQRALQLGGDAGQPDVATVFGTQLIMVQLVRGTLGALLPLIEQVVADNPIPVFTAVLALAHADADRFDEARSILDSFAKSGFELPLDVTWLTAMIACAETASACGDDRYAGPLLEQLAPFSDQWLCTDVSASGPVSRTVADLLTILGRYEEAERQIAEARASCERTGATFFGTQADLSWGRLMIMRDAHGDRDRGREVLQRVRQVGAARGYATVERRANVLLQRLGT
jgi:DNA-binding SARP family transcriptional activator